MAKRPAEDGADDEPMKDGGRPQKTEDGEEVEFEDDYDDEFESEDEVLEAGVDGRPDEEREAEEQRGTWPAPKALCECPPF